jgi:hypothetical protein
LSRGVKVIFYFQEHVEFDTICVNGTVNTYKFRKAEEEVNQKTENSQCEYCSSGNYQNKVINYVQNLSEVVTDVPNLVKILQTKSRSKIESAIENGKWIM